MKKAYNSPKAEKMEFEYSDTVVASTTPGCINKTEFSHTNQEAAECTSVKYPTWTGDNGI